MEDPTQVRMYISELNEEPTEHQEWEDREWSEEHTVLRTNIRRVCSYRMH